MWGAEANKPYGFFMPFPAETRDCEGVFHCIHWSGGPRNIIILAMNEVSPLALTFSRLSQLYFHLSGARTILSPKLEFAHHRIQNQFFVLLNLKPVDGRWGLKQ
jgi:hypothetical protein